MNKSMASNRSNDNYLRVMNKKLKECLVSDAFGEFIVVVKLQGGVIQQISLKRFNKQDVVILEP